ncbi:hypothetical protein ACLB2K_072730 [Fragaria x ananassa]
MPNTLAKSYAYVLATLSICQAPQGTWTQRYGHAKPLSDFDLSRGGPSKERTQLPLEKRRRLFSSANMQASDRFNINSQLEHLQAKYVGTGHADLHRYEWAVNIQRDSYASYVGHYPILSYFALAENESIGRERYNFMQAGSSFYTFMHAFDLYCRMLLPCGPPPEREDD